MSEYYQRKYLKYYQAKYLKYKKKYSKKYSKKELAVQYGGTQCDTYLKKYNIFCVIKYYLIRFFSSILSHKILLRECFLHGGNIQFSQVDTSYFTNIIDEIFKLGDEELCKKFVEVFYSEDVDIVTTIHELNSVHYSITNYTNDPIYVSIFEYIKYIICLNNGLDYAKSKISTEESVWVLPDGSAKIIRMFLLIETETGENIKYELTDIAGKQSYHYVDPNSIYDMVTIEMKFLLDNFKLNAVPTKRDKRIYRMFMYIQMIKNLFINYSMQPQNQLYLNSLKSDYFKKNINDIWHYCIEYIHDRNIPYFVIDRVNDAMHFKINSDLPTNNTTIDDDVFEQIVNTIMLKSKPTGLNQVCSLKNLSSQSITTLDISAKINRKLYIDISAPLLNNIQRYLDELKKLDQNSNLRTFTADGYKLWNPYMFERYYNSKSSENASYNEKIYDIYNIIVNISRLNHHIFENPDEYFYVYRFENFINTGPMGSYENLNVGDEYVIPTIYSTSLVCLESFAENRILLKIKLNKNSIFALVTSYSNSSEEREITLAFGTVLKVVSREHIILQTGKPLLIVTTEFVRLVPCSSTEDFIDKYINTYLKNNKIAVVGQRPNKIKFNLSQFGSNSVAQGMNVLVNSLPKQIINNNKTDILDALNQNILNYYNVTTVLSSRLNIALNFISKNVSVFPYDINVTPDLHTDTNYPFNYYLPIVNGNIPSEYFEKFVYLLKELSKIKINNVNISFAIDHYGKAYTSIGVMDINNGDIAKYRYDY